MSIYTLGLFLALGSPVAVPPLSFGPAGASCPANASEYLEYVRQFFVVEESRPLREQYGLLNVGPGDIRILTDENDAEACRRMSRAVIIAQNGPYPKVWRGYQAGDFYVMLVTRETPPGVFYHGGGTGMILLDKDMRIVAAVS